MGFLSSGCGSSTQLTDLETGLGALEGEVRALRTEAATREELSDLGSALEDLVERNVSVSADLKQDLRQIIAEIEALRTSTQEQWRIGVQSLARIDGLAAELELLQSRLESHDAWVSDLVQQADAGQQPPATEALDPQTIYDRAYDHYGAGRYEQAARSFEQYLESFPSGVDADNARYWLGESYMGLGRFRAAIVELTRVVELYPESDKVASSLLRLGVAHTELDETDLASEMLERVRREYPDSDEAVLALQQLDNQRD